MANFIGELLFVMVRTLVGRCAYSAWIKVGTWLDGKIPGRRIKFVVGCLLGLAAYILIPIFVGLLGF
jgi:hypothetical protein